MSEFERKKERFMEELSPKQRKELKRCRKNLCLCIVISLLADLFFVYFFMQAYHDNLPLEGRKARTVSGYVEEVEILHGLRRRRSLSIQIEGREYSMKWFGGREKIEEYADYLRSERPYVTITNLQQKPFLGVIESRGDNVSISDSKYTYDSTERLERNMARDRSGCICLVVVMGSILLAIEMLFLLIYVGDYRDMKLLKKRRRASIERQRKRRENKP